MATPKEPEKAYKDYDIKMVCRVCGDDPCNILTSDGKVPSQYECEDADFKVED